MGGKSADLLPKLILSPAKSVLCAWWISYKGERRKPFKNDFFGK